MPVNTDAHPQEDKVRTTMSDTIRAELSAAAEALERYRLRVSGLVDTVGPDNEDLVSALYEAERALLGAQRLVARAGKMAR